jgi:hypothetical protein
MAIEAKVLMVTKANQNLEAREINYASIARKTITFISECYKLKNKEKGTGTYREKCKPNDEGNASVAASKADNSTSDMLVAFARCANSDDEWILDSAASFHICINRDWFVTYDSL